MSQLELERQDRSAVIEAEPAMKSASPSKEGGFTLLEILIAMIVLAVGGVSILSLFAAAVKLQYTSVIDRRKASVISEAVVKAQEVLNAHRPTADRPVPDAPKLEDWVEKHCPKDFKVAMAFSEPANIPPGEGAVAEITLFYRDRPVETIRHILQRTVIAESEIEESVSYKQEQLEKEKERVDKGRPGDK